MAARVRSNDTVEVMTGRDRGRRGEVRQVLPARQRAIVTGVNMVKKHRRARTATEASGIIEVEATVHLSNLRVVCASCDRAVRVGFRFLEDGRKVRYCKQCDETVD